jgi:transcriptional regulator with XRE-family HTH domain
MQREELLQSKSYWSTSIQLELFTAIETYMRKNKLNKTQLAEKLKFSKGYISQVLNGDFDHKLSKMVELSLSCDSVPLIFFVDKETFIKNDSQDNTFELVSKKRKENHAPFSLPLEQNFPLFEKGQYNLPIEKTWSKDNKGVKPTKSMSFVLGGNVTNSKEKVV